MAQCRDPSAEETQLLSDERTGFVGVEGEKGVREEPLAAKLTRWSLGAVAWAAVLYYVFLLVAMPTAYGRELLFGLNWLFDPSYYGKGGKPSSPVNSFNLKLTQTPRSV
jgi:hypothetical protein